MRQYQAGGYRFPPAYRVATDLRRRPDLVIGRAEALPVTAEARPRDPWRWPDADERVDPSHDLLGIGHQVLIANPVAAFRLLLLHLADQRGVIQPVPGQRQDRVARRSHDVLIEPVAGQSPWARVETGPDHV